MPAPTITPAPDPPLRSEAPATFTSKAEAFVNWLAGLPAELNALATYLQELVAPDGPVSSVVMTDANDYTVEAEDAGKYIRLTNGATKLITVRDNADHALLANSEWHFRVVGGDATFVEDTSVTINVPTGGSLVVEDGGTVTLKRVAVDEFDLIGITVAP